jgi:F0F1-type ATP synthase membrane subunit b/b'
MVTLNATIVVCLVLFLAFLWGTQRFILTPVLQNLDEREDTIEQNRDQSEANTTASQALENKYRHDIAVIRRDADAQVRMAQQKSQHEHARFLAEERTKAEHSIAEVRAEAQQLIDAQRDAIAAEVPDLVKRIAVALTQEGRDA